ncbi:hypothetical protein NP493_522g02058 [Ridgeia piscesae]|uniref:Uncharacterized protein n=1 Tax=Ridgeia piscesae TaxID=27915 RepID=A0AAD9KWI4_RIDPI|nr:hypothetical protein NP493_522g02058 [Ridgeia piscesae]
MRPSQQRAADAIGLTNRTLDSLTIRLLCHRTIMSTTLQLKWIIDLYTAFTRLMCGMASLRRSSYLWLNFSTNVCILRSCRVRHFKYTPFNLHRNASDRNAVKCLWWMIGK